ncbi:MAG: hypothetical protein AAF415_06270 [Pseudomonadota bacterium]
MQTAAKTATAKGRYFWELIFSFANEDNGDVATIIKREVEIVTKRSIDSRRFVSNTFSIQSGFEFRKEASASLNFKGVGEGSATSEFSTHLQVANEITRTFETQTSIEEQQTERQVYHIGPGDTINLYRLVYAFEGSLVHTNVVATEPREDIEVELGFGVEEKILGLSEILDALQSIRPGRDNKGEWSDIRSVIVSARDKSYEEAFRSLVEVLAETSPRRDNKGEWREIRQTCGEILEAWETTNKHMLLRKLLNRFLVTKPRRDNKKEWAHIRRVSSDILQDLRQVF